MKSFEENELVRLVNEDGNWMGGRVVLCVEESGLERFEDRDVEWDMYLD